nr:DUF2064 domain-containing protein [Salinibacter ruber]
MNKQLVGQDYAQSRRVAAAFYDHARRAVADSGLPAIEVNGAQQRGRNFGARLANAVADAFAAGYEHVIAVGNDCPALHEVDWAAVTEQLEAGRPVLGPTSGHDGAYLIGLSRDQFEHAAFAALPWTTDGLFPALHRHLVAASGAAPVRLAVRDDVNEPAGLRALLRRNRAGALAARLRRVLGSTHCTSHVPARSTTRPVLERRSRAPPYSSLLSRR